MLRKVLIAFIMTVLFLSACSSENASKETTFDFSVEDLENRINDALKQMGSETNLKILSSEVNKDGRHVITLSDQIMFFIDANEKDKVTAVSLAAMSDSAITKKEDLMFSFKLLVGTVDDSLKDGERNSVVSKLGLNDNNLLDHTEVVNNNGIQYTYKGSTDDNIVLQAIKK